MSDQSIGIYTINDKVAESSCNPFYSFNDGVALRQFKIILEQAPIHIYSEFDLYLLGDYDPVKLEFKILERPKLIANGNYFIPKKEQEEIK